MQIVAPKFSLLLLTISRMLKIMMLIINIKTIKTITTTITEGKDVAASNRGLVAGNKL